MSSVLILTYHFYPSNEIGARRVTALARYLAERGVRVVVVSGFGPQSLALDSEIFPRVTAIQVQRPSRRLLNALVALKRRFFRSRASVPNASTPDSQSAPVVHRTYLGLAFRALRNLYFRTLFVVDDYKRWSWRASRAAVLAGKRHGVEVIVASGPPHSAQLAAARAAAKLGIPYVADLRDPWSDTVSEATATGRIEIRFVRFLERWAINQAAMITSTSDAVATLLGQRYPEVRSRIRVIRNGYDGGIATGLSRTSGRLSVLFAGELYVGRDPFPFLEALEWLLTRPGTDATRIQAIFMGNVRAYSGRSLSDWLRGKRSESVVKILPPQPPEAVVAAVADATLLLNLAQQQPLSVPAKTFEHLASGREILLICERGCETATLVSGIRGVNVVDPAEPEALQDILLDLYRRHALQGAAMAPSEAEAGKYSRASANAQFHAALESLAGSTDADPVIG